MYCKCGKKAIIFRRYSGEKLCERCFNKSMVERVKKVIRKYSLIEKNDLIGVGVSGGKDSLVLLHILKKLSEKYPFDLIAITIDEGIKGYRDKSIRLVQKNCKSWGIESKIYSFKEEFGYTLDEIVKRDRELSPCSYCGVFRRYLLNKKARELGCDKLAVGHNLDDEVQTILMNFLRGDLSRFGRTGSYYIRLNEKFVPRIKPLREIPEKEDVIYALVNNIDVEFSECPYAGEAYRNNIREFLNKMEMEQPTTKYSLLRSYDKIYPLLAKNLTKEVRYCRNCGEPTIGEICKTCELLENL
ncbi:MAG: TIGR00269 family protein [Methanomicrobia archaeon]|nr:TIGR00269 family protein [Methanomicrobia archaeon]